MPPLLSLPGYGFNPQNALLNFDPVNQGIGTYRKGMEEERQGNVSRDVGNRLMSKDYGGAASAAIAGGMPQLASAAYQGQQAATQQRGADLDFATRMAATQGAAADRALASGDDNAMRATWQRLQSSHPEYGAALQKFGVDPNDHKAGLSFIRDQSASHLAEMKLKTNQVEQIPIQNERARVELENAKAPFVVTGTDRFGQPLHGFVDRTNKTVQTPTQVGPNGQPVASGAPGLPPGAGAPSGEDFLKTLDAPTAAQVKGIADGRIAFPGAFALKTPYWQKIIEMVTQYDPSFDSVNFNARNQTRKDFTSGKAAQNITAFNTAIGHLDSLDKSIDGLGNSSYPMYNKARQYLGEQTGDTQMQVAKSKFEANKTAVIEELTKAFKGTAGSLTEVHMWEKQIDTAKSPEALKAVVKQAVDLLESRIDAVKVQYEKGMGTTATTLPGLTPKALSTIERLKGNADPNKVQGSLNDKPPPVEGAPQQPLPRLTNDAAGHAAYEALPPGARFVDDQGYPRTKGGK